jgi:HAAS domain-containing protein
VIEAYLHELAGRLDVPTRTRARILAEVRDHLMESAAHHSEGGLPPREAEERAVDAFGPPAELAHDFHLQLASNSARRSSLLTAVALACSLLLLALIGSGPLSDHAPWTSAGLYGLVSFFAAQVAVVAGAIGIARWVRYRHEALFPAERLEDTRRANAVALACTTAIMLAQAVGLLLHAGSLGDSGWTIVLTAATAALAVVALGGVAALLRALARSRPVAVTDPERDDALADLLAAGRLEVALPGWIDLRAHPWRFCLLFAASCGIAVAAGHALLDGGFATVTWAAIGRMLLAALVLAAIEGAAVVTAFASLGRFLRIRA